MVKISVKNFGPIIDGSVEVKPLTIFVGPSNSGKSYMAMAIYALMQGFRPLALHSRALKQRPSRYHQIGFTLRRDLYGFGRPLTRDQEQAFQRVSGIVRESNAISPGVEFSYADLTKAVQELTRTLVIDQFELMYGDFLAWLDRVHGPMSELVRRGSQAESSEIIVVQEHPFLRIPTNLTSSMDEGCEFLADELIPSDVCFNEVLAPMGSMTADSAGSFHFLNWLTELGLGALGADFSNASYYLPAGRAGIALGQKAIVSALIHRSAIAGIEPISIPTLSGVVSDFMGHLLELGDSQDPERGSAEIRTIGEYLESQIAKGRIYFHQEQTTPYSELVYEQARGGTPFPLHKTSSMISELAPVILFLKGLVNPGDFLVFEEPESHLHPAAQLQMARGIARLVNAGVKVLVTTHSGDFVGQIDNLISMSNVGEETTKSLGLEPEECLQPEQVSAYGFRIDPDLGGAVTYPLPVGSDVGIEDGEFLPVSELLYEQAIALQRNRLT